MIIEFRCHADNKLLALLDAACPKVQVKCDRCGQIREYTTDPKRKFAYAAVAVSVDRRQTTVV